MLPITRNAKEPRSNMTVQYLSQNQPKPSLRGFSVLRHPNHLLFAGVKKRNVIITVPNNSMRSMIKNVIITKRLHVAPDQANRDFFLHTYCIFQL